MNLSVRPSHSQEKQHSQEGEEKFPTAFTVPVSFQPLFPASLLHSQELMSSLSLQHSPPHAAATPQLSPHTSWPENALQCPAGHQPLLVACHSGGRKE